MDMDTAKLLTFLNEFRALECAVCNTVFGFQQKATGSLICTGGCHQRDCAAAMNKEMLATTVTTRSVSVQTPSLASAPSPQAQPAMDQAHQEVLAPEMLKPITEVSSTQPIPRTETSADVVNPKGKSRQEIKAPVSGAPVVEIPKPKPAPAQRWFAKWKDCKYSPNLLKPNADVKVYNTWSSSRLLVVASKDDDALIDFQFKVRKYLLRRRRLVNKPKIGQVVIAEYEGEYYRGVVIAINYDVCTVTLVDHGGQIARTQKELIEVDATLMKYPIYALYVELENVTAPPGSEREHVPDELEEFIYENSYQLELSEKGCLKHENEAIPRPISGILWLKGGGLTLKEKLQELWSRVNSRRAGILRQVELHVTND